MSAQNDLERKLVAKLKRLQKDWPKGYWLFSASGTLHLMRMHPDGTRNVPGEDGMDHSLIVDSFRKIQNDGGDW